MWETEASLSRTDSLTGAMNIRAFFEIVEYQIISLQRQSSPYTMAYIDIDNFKEVNDRYGHKKGDDLLKTIVRCFVGSLRKTDLVARMGGDEFIIFLPSTNQEAAKITMNKIMTNISMLSEPYFIHTTLSVGVVTCVKSEIDIHDIIIKADELMYDVKNSGKNNVYFAES
jgi:diguanylate cyclase (GGDEF)-like protein